MKTARIFVLTLFSSCCLLGVLASAKPAQAQCVPDPPIGTTAIRPCNVDQARTAPQEPVATVAGVPLSTFMRDPIISSVTWLATERMTTPRQRAALRPYGIRERSLRGGQTPKQVAW
jgi:hypothetical protein